MRDQWACHIVDTVHSAWWTIIGDIVSRLHSSTKHGSQSITELLASQPSLQHTCECNRTSACSVHIQVCVRISKLSASKPSALVPLSRCLDPYPLRPQIMEFRKKTSKVFIFSKIILFVLFGMLLLYVTIQGSNLSASVITSTAGLRLLPTVNQNVALQRALM